MTIDSSWHPRQRIEEHQNLIHQKFHTITKAEKKQVVSPANIPSPEPIIVSLPGTSSGTLIISETNHAAIVINDTNLPFKGKVVVCNYETGNIDYTFELDRMIMNLKHHRDILFVQRYNGLKIQAWNLKIGKEVMLPSTWDRVDGLCVGEMFLAHNNFVNQTRSIDQYKPITLIISDPKTLACVNTIQTSFSSFIYGMTIQEDNLFVYGPEENSSYDKDYNGSWSALACYQRPFENIPKIRKATYFDDGNGIIPDSLKTCDATVYKTRSFTSVNTFWDTDTLNEVMTEKTEKHKDDSVLSAILEDWAVVFTPTGMEIKLKKDNQFTTVKSIEWNENDSGSCLELFRFNNAIIAVEGYSSGIVRIRNVDTANVIMEFSPPESMQNVKCTQVHNNKLLVQYIKPSKEEGTLAIVWNLDQQKPDLFIRREALKGKDYDASLDEMHIIGDDIFVTSQDQALIYKNVFNR